MSSSGPKGERTPIKEREKMERSKFMAAFSAFGGKSEQPPRNFSGVQRMFNMSKSRSRRGGICPAEKHANFGNITLGQAQDLGRVHEAKERKLDSIPDGFRLENTGLRIETKGLKLRESVQFRALIGATTKESKRLLRPIELGKRSKAEWNGFHFRLENGNSLVARLQLRDGDQSAWKDALSITIEPLEAFVVEGQDTVLHSKSAEIGGESVTVWFELSLTRKTSVFTRQSLIVGTKYRHIDQVHFEPKSRDPEEVEEDAELLQSLLEYPDPMTPTDRVFMKHIWNKCLGWIDLTGEFIVDGIFLKCPDLLQILGPITAELMFDMMISLIDKSIRNLDARTEVIAREAYHSMPLGKPIDHPFDSLEEGFRQFAQLGMRPRHWKEARSLFLLAMQKANPYLEEADDEMLELGLDSCAYRFWTWHVMLPAIKAIEEVDDIFESTDNRAILRSVFEPLSKDKKAAGMKFYKILLTRNPEVIPYFGTTDMDFLAGHLFDAVGLLVETFNDFGKAIPVLNQLGKLHDNIAIPIDVYPAIGGTLDAAFRSLNVGYGDSTPRGQLAVSLWSALMNRAVLVLTRISFVSERLLRKAFEWSEQVAGELELGGAWLSKRKIDIEAEIRTSGTYTHTEEEVIHGARVAWRNSAKCVGRIAWNTMLVRDRRHITDLDQMFAECVEHQRLATADGSLKAVMTVFRARKPGTRLGFRFWNPQLIRFACYEMADGSYMGDQANLEYTKECIEFGWKPPEQRSEFDVLPVVIEDTVSGVTKMFEVPKEYHKVTMIEHPNYPEFGKLGLRWCVVPTVTSFTLTLGGLQYTCCPFNGWFMETEITRDLIEPRRMDKMEAIAHAIGVDPTDEDGFWRERVAIETNRAVVYSFRRDGNSIVDHVTAQAQFLAHDLREKREGRECPAQWSWVVPSFGGSTLPIWHHEMRDFYIEPSFLYQAEVHVLRKLSNIPESALLESGSTNKFSFEKILILYSSVTGTAEGYAYRAKKMLMPLHVDVKSVDKVDVKVLWKDFVKNGGPYSALLVITSTFGEGDPPPTGAKFLETVSKLPVSALSGVDFSVMAIGSRVYPDFCKAGIDLDYWLRQAGANQLLPLKKADELNDQAGTVVQWIESIAHLFSVEQKRALVLSGDLPGFDEPNDEGPPVVVEFLEDHDPTVQEALAEEERFVLSASATGPEENRKSEGAQGSVGVLGRFLPDDYRMCQVTKNEELVDFSLPGSEKMFKKTKFLEFDLHGLSKDGKVDSLVYETGDHARILPVNASDVVSAMCQCLQLSPLQWVRVTIKEGYSRQLTTPVARVGDLFSLEIDLATKEDDSNLPFLQRLVEISRSAISEENGVDEILKSLITSENAQLEKLVESLTKTTDDAVRNDQDEISVQQGNIEASFFPVAENEAADKRSSLRKSRRSSVLGFRDAIEREAAKKASRANIFENYMDVPSILEDFPATSSLLSLADCIETLPRLKPRFYSIASAAEKYPKSLQLTVGVLSVIHKSTSKKRLGICSNYLSQTTVDRSSAVSTDIICANAANFVRLSTTKSSFRLPQDMEYPVIMVGPGTGISPMLGFLQAREKALEDGVKLGPCMVFFGCRTEQDFLHREQMRNWETSGVISSLQVAFSRLEGKPKEYVQHRISKIREEVWEILKCDNCHYYVCGDSNMAEDVYDELFVTAEVAGGLDHKHAWDFFQKMKKERRFQADTWGVVMNRQEGLAKQTEKKYNQAAMWLAKQTESK